MRWGWKLRFFCMEVGLMEMCYVSMICGRAVEKK